MTTTMRSILDKITNTAVPPRSNAELERMRLEKKVSGFEYASDLPFQMCIYFNVFYIPFWTIGVAIAEYNEYGYMNEINQVASLALFILFVLLEVIRLYLGFYGNLMEKVPAQAGCLLLSLFIQLPIIIILMVFEQMIISPFERIIHVLEFAFILLELFLGYFALRRMVDNQAVKFYTYLNFDDVETMSATSESNGGVYSNVRYRPSNTTNNNMTTGRYNA